jgi:cytoskeletal protein CcmA (bactofilin family)
MFGNKDKGASKPQSRIDCLIGAGTVVEGNIVFVGGLRIDGTVKGSVAAAEGNQGTLVLSEQAAVEGEIHVAHVVVNGAVRGPIHASESVELQARANVSGDVHYRTLEVQLGAIVEGRLVHQDAARSDKVVQLKPATSD